MRSIRKKYIVKNDEKVVISIPETKSEYIKTLKDEVFDTDNRTLITALINIIDEENIFNTRAMTDLKGVAKCHENDSFDEFTGKVIASSKTDIKYHKSAAVDYQKAADKLKKAYELAEHLSENHKEKYKSIKNKINKY